MFTQVIRVSLYDMLTHSFTDDVLSSSTCLMGSHIAAHIYLYKKTFPQEVEDSK